jgi:[CysO sulfur-carrier protein]-S-L-cysteine hydrolase
MSGRPVEIPPALLDEIYAEARRAFPAECCGFLVGPRGGDTATRVRPCRNAQAEGEHPTATARERGAETAYVIAGEDLLALARSFDGPEPARVIYHSHPNGRAYFSAVDAEVAASPWGDGPMYPVQQLVVGLNRESIVEARLFDWDEERREFVEVARFAGDVEE